jgi:hypothetical protein
MQDHELTTIDAEAQPVARIAEPTQPDDVVPEAKRPIAVGDVEVHRAVGQGIRREDP